MKKCFLFIVVISVALFHAFTPTLVSAQDNMPPEDESVLEDDRMPEGDGGLYDGTEPVGEDVLTDFSADSSQALFEQSAVSIQDGKGRDVSRNANSSVLMKLTRGTFIISFSVTGQEKYQTLFSIGNGKKGQQDRHFHLYVTSDGGVGMELRNTDGSFKYTLYRPAALQGNYKGQAAENTIAFTADDRAKEYKLFLNGQLLASLPKADYKFISDIEGVDNIMLGGVVRQGSVAYPFGGTLHSVKVYDHVLTNDELIRVTGTTSYGRHIFKSGDRTKANYFRIPTLLTLKSGTVIATADARYGGTHDAKSNIDIAFSKSNDNGATWDEPTLPLCFSDYVAQAVEWPRDPVGKNVQIQGSASFIDSVTIQDKYTGRLFLFADAMPAGIGFSNTAAGSGFKTVNGKKYIKLCRSGEGNNEYHYTIRENGVIYDDTKNKPTDYTVDGDYNLLEKGNYLMQKQYQVHFEGTKLIEEKAATDTRQNIFYKDSLFKVLPTNYIVMKYSDDEGETWSSMSILGDFKRDDQRMPLFGPGVGTQIERGTYAGRMLISMYNSVSAEFGFLYSDDHGSSWQYKTTDLGGSGTFAEAQTVELPDGTLQTYMRTSAGKIGLITSVDGGLTWTKQTFVPGMQAASYGTQLSVVKYSGKIDGKDAILLSAPNSSSARRGGKIWIGLIEDTGKQGTEKYAVNWKYCYSVDRDTYGFAYSCLTVLPDGKIGILYEKYDSWSREELHLKDILTYEVYELDELLVSR